MKVEFSAKGEGMKNKTETGRDSKSTMRVVFDLHDGQSFVANVGSGIEETIGLKRLVVIHHGDRVEIRADGNGGGTEFQFSEKSPDDTSGECDFLLETPAPADALGEALDTYFFSRLSDKIFTLQADEEFMERYKEARTKLIEAFLEDAGRQLIDLVEYPN